ncbi:MAG: prepilin-type N-terminal cleavage/methylation domain-containing protein [Planctomycetes bacterium]|nr:prepilin-type N-terminal cleavage/methylation domain-containing protein [Planctomycetota bacterium]
MHPNRAYTLVELLISIAIGAMLCTTAFVAVRVTSQAMATGNRLSLENQLLRAGVQAGLDELESWKHYDGASAPTQQLRADKHPFLEVTQSEEFNFDYLPVRDLTLPGSPAENYEKWWRRDSRTWFRADPNTVVGGPGDHGLGDYGLFGYYGMPSDSTILGGAEKRWRHNLMHEMSQHLGYYALIDYAPANSLYQYYVWNDHPWWPGVGTPWEFLDQTMGGTGVFYGHTWEEAKPRDFVALTIGAYITVADPTTAPPPYQTDEINRSVFLSWYDFDTGAGPNPGWSVDDAYNKLAGRVRLLPLKPTSWPELSLSVRHYAANARQFHSATVMTRSPVTSQVFKLFFTYTGSTLRGARKVRQLDGAWP